MADDQDGIVALLGLRAPGQLPFRSDSKLDFDISMPISEID
jgi:hypothetical protein